MKKQLGQFFTTNSDYILQGLECYIKDKEVVDPFAGSQDLILWAKKNGCKLATGFDCDNKYVDNKVVFFNDSINTPKEYSFVCTNPPYLHKNKADEITKNDFFSGINSRYEDLYQVSIISLLNSQEGIIIVPLNFLCAENSKKVRNEFFECFKIVKMNIFSEQVFDDTTYNVIAFYYQQKMDGSEENNIPATIYPEGKNIEFVVNKQHGWQFGGDFINRINSVGNQLGVYRLTEDNLQDGEYKVEIAIQNIKDKKIINISKDIKNILDKNILFLRAIDSKNGKKIQLEDIRNYGIAGLAGKNSSRNMAHLIFKNEISIEEQLCLMQKFNDELEDNRQKYLSFFLTNFRDNNRKRISFDLAYKFLNYIYGEKNTKQSVFI